MRFFYSDIFFYIWCIPKIKITHVTTNQCFNHRYNSIIFLKRKIGLCLFDNTEINSYS